MPPKRTAICKGQNHLGQRLRGGMHTAARRWGRGGRRRSLRAPAGARRAEDRPEAPMQPTGVYAAGKPGALRHGAGRQRDDGVAGAGRRAPWPWLPAARWRGARLLLRLPDAPRRDQTGSPARSTRKDSPSQAAAPPPTGAGPRRIGLGRQDKERPRPTRCRPGPCCLWRRRADSNRRIRVLQTQPLRPKKRVVTRLLGRDDPKCSRFVAGVVSRAIRADRRRTWPHHSSTAPAAFIRRATSSMMSAPARFASSRYFA